MKNLKSEIIITITLLVFAVLGTYMVSARTNDNAPVQPEMPAVELPDNSGAVMTAVPGDAQDGEEEVLMARNTYSCKQDCNGNAMCNEDSNNYNEWLCNWCKDNCEER